MTTIAFTGLLSTVLYVPGIEKVSCATVTGANGDAPRSKPAAEAAAASQPTVVVIVADQLAPMPLRLAPVRREDQRVGAGICRQVSSGSGRRAYRRAPPPAPCSS